MDVVPQGVSFAVADEPESVFGVETESVVTGPADDFGSLQSAELDYIDSGGNDQTTGAVYWNGGSLVGIGTQNDLPKAQTIVNELNSGAGLSLHAPDYPQEAVVQFYRTFGYNGFVVSFTEEPGDYSYTSPHTPSEKPQEVMENRAASSRRQRGDDWLAEIVDEFIEEGYYVDAMDCIFEEGGDRYRFGSPMWVGYFSEDGWGSDLLELIFHRMRQIHENAVPTVEEVKS